MARDSEDLLARTKAVFLCHAGQPTETAEGLAAYPDVIAQFLPVRLRAHAALTAFASQIRPYVDKSFAPAHASLLPEELIVTYLAPILSETEELSYEVQVEEWALATADRVESRIRRLYGRLSRAIALLSKLGRDGVTNAAVAALTEAQGLLHPFVAPIGAPLFRTPRPRRYRPPRSRVTATPALSNAPPSRHGTSEISFSESVARIFAA